MADTVDFAEWLRGPEAAQIVMGESNTFDGLQKLADAAVGASLADTGKVEATLEERIDHAAYFIQERFGVTSLEEARSAAKYVLFNGCPEVFQEPPTHWLAPMEMSEEMFEVFGEEEAAAWWEAAIRRRKALRPIAEQHEHDTDVGRKLRESAKRWSAAPGESLGAAWVAMRDAYLKEKVPA